jgi:hypothetical protein
LAISARAASRSPYGTNATGPNIGPKPSRYLAWPVIDTVAIVRPWKLPWVEMIVVRAGWPATTCW